MIMISSSTQDIFTPDLFIYKDKHTVIADKQDTVL